MVIQVCGQANNSCDVPQEFLSPDVLQACMLPTAGCCTRCKAHIYRTHASRMNPAALQAPCCKHTAEGWPMPAASPGTNSSVFSGSASTFCPEIVWALVCLTSVCRSV